MLTTSLMLQDGEPADKAGPRPVAAVPGTTVCVEDLFYNVVNRRKVHIHPWPMDHGPVHHNPDGHCFLLKRVAVDYSSTLLKLCAGFEEPRG
jgi:hypothetical protein